MHTGSATVSKDPGQRRDLTTIYVSEQVANALSHWRLAGRLTGRAPALIDAPDGALGRLARPVCDERGQRPTIPARRARRG
jgi:hypothetical protein